MPAAIVVHGGAGRAAPEDREPRRTGVARAAQAGWAVLAAGGTALDAVVAAVVVLEDDPQFNAGTGSVLTTEGTVEMDASVMTGHDLAAGAVGAVTGVRNPVLLARAVMDAGREVMLIGPAATSRAATLGVPACDPEALITPEARRRWQAREPASGETVGAVARDNTGRVAAATSTGGVAGKAPGRVGDSAVIGAGTYADDTLGAGSATGPGEAIIRLGLVRVALTRVAAGLAPRDAARDALGQLRVRVGAQAGLILVDASGAVGFSRTTESMPVAYRTDELDGIQATD
jgi:beta-aspartyl-peptidase (threonine type)